MHLWKDFMTIPMKTRFTDTNRWREQIAAVFASRCFLKRVFSQVFLPQEYLEPRNTRLDINTGFVLQGDWCFRGFVLQGILAPGDSCSRGFVLQGIHDTYSVLQGIHDTYSVLQGIHDTYSVLQGIHDTYSVLQGIRAPGEIIVFFLFFNFFPKKNVETGNPGEWCAKQFSLGFWRFSFRDAYIVLQVFFGKNEKVFMMSKDFLHDTYSVLQDSCHILRAPGYSWYILRSPGSSRYILRSPGSSWYILRSPGSSWYILRAPGDSWYILRAPGDSWYILRAPGDSWYILRSPGSSWYIISVLQDSWYILRSPGFMIHTPFSRIHDTYSVLQDSWYILRSPGFMIHTPFSRIHDTYSVLQDLHDTYSVL